MNLAELFYEQVQKNKSKTALICENEQLTYEQLGRLVNKYSNFLLENGVKYGDHIGVTLDNTIQSVILMLACANNGLALVPIHTSMPKEVIQKAFSVANVRHVIATNNFYKKQSCFDIEGTYFCLDAKMDGKLDFTELTLVSSNRPIIKEVTGNEPFIITMTSGSTGRPKPILLTQQNKYKRIIAHIKLYNICSEDYILTATPLHHSLAERLVLIPLVTGGTSVLMSRYTAKRWIEYVERYKVTFTIMVSAQLNQIVKILPTLTNNELRSLRAIVSSSALLENECREQLLNCLKCDFYEMYGTSETSTVTSINFKESFVKQNSVGRPLEEAKVIILKDDYSLAGTGEVGEIACSTGLQCEGYYNNNELFNDSLFNGYFKTGDLGYVDEDEFLYFVGRKKELIITGGINVYPIDVDNCYKKMDGILDCAAFSYPDNNLGEIVALAVVCGKENNLTKKEILKYGISRLTDYQQPQKVFFVEELPKNSMGKLMRTSIYEMIKGGDENEH